MDRDLVLNFVFTLVSDNLHYVVPTLAWCLAVWRVARLRGLTPQDYQERVSESVADTLKEQLSQRVLDPLFETNHVLLPANKTSYDVIEVMVAHDPTNVSLLAQIYDSLINFGAGSPYYEPAVQIAHSFFNF